MTDDILDDPILDDRIRRALAALADSHTPLSAGPAAREPKDRRLLAAAAAVLVLCGVGALVLTGQRNGAESPVSTQAPTPVDSAAPEPTTTAVPMSTAPITDAFRFDRPLPDDTIAVLDPAPSPFVEAFRVEQPDRKFLTGIGTSVQILVLDADGGPEATVSIADLDVPFDTIESRETLPVGDASTLSYAGVGAETFYVVAGPSIRALSVPNLRSTDSEFSQFDERLPLAIEVAEYVEGQQLGDLVRSGRFAPFPALSVGPTVASYTETGVQGDGPLAEVAVITTDRAIGTDEFRLVASGFGEIIDQPAPHAVVAVMIESPQLLYFEQISATQFVLITTDPDTDRATLDRLVSSLTFVDAAAAGIDVDTLGGDIAPAIARGDDGWGRWELYEPSDADGCYGFGVVVWGSDGTDTQHTSNASCSPTGGATPDLLCLTMSNRELTGLYVGVGVIEFGHPSIGLAVVGEPGDPIDGLGTPTSFMIEPAADFRTVSVLIDGGPVELPC